MRRWICWVRWARLARNQRAEITVFQMSEVQESPAFNGRRSFLTLQNFCLDIRKAALSVRVLKSISTYQHRAAAGEFR